MIQNDSMNDINFVPERREDIVGRQHFRHNVCKLRLTEMSRSKTGMFGEK